MLSRTRPLTIPKVTLALASLAASASAAMALCSCTGSLTSFTSTRSTLTPQGSVASSSSVFITLEIVSLSLRISDRFLVPKTLRSVVAASSLVEWLKQEFDFILLQIRQNPIMEMLLAFWLPQLYIKAQTPQNTWFCSHLLARKRIQVFLTCNRRHCTELARPWRRWSRPRRPPWPSRSLWTESTKFWIDRTEWEDLPLPTIIVSVHGLWKAL